MSLGIERWPRGVAALAMVASSWALQAWPVWGEADTDVVCAGPVDDAEPGTPEWIARDAGNVFCAELRHLDKALHPVTALPVPRQTGGSLSAAWNDAYRDPERHDGIRFRYETAEIGGLSSEVYRPCATGTCDLPEGLETYEPPYPAVIVIHGGASRRELHWWSTQTLAEAGYLAVSFNTPGYPSGPTIDHARTVLEWLVDPSNPLAAEIDTGRIGIAGHSQGGQVASVFGQQDPRISAIVSWDRGTTLVLPDELDTPTLFTIADYACQANPFCQPEPYLEAPPDPRGPGGRGREYEVVSAAGVDSMKIAMRASTHLDWVPSTLAGNRYVEILSVYYTLAWFDRYLKGADDPALAADAYARLTAGVFDDSADVHNISQGFWDPAKAAVSGDPLYGGNVPYTLAGRTVAHHLSFYFPSKCSLSVPGSPGERAESDDIRASGCAVTNP